MSILNLLRRKKKPAPEELFTIPLRKESPSVLSGQSDGGILIDMGDIIADPDTGIYAHEAKSPGIPVYTPVMYAADVGPEVRLLVDTSALQTDEFIAAAQEHSGSSRLDEAFASVYDPAAEPGTLLTSDQSAEMANYYEPKRRYGRQEIAASESKPDPFDGGIDGIIIIGEWEHTEPGGVIGFDPGLNAAHAWMSERSSPLLIIDKSVDLSLQSATQAASAETDLCGEESRISLQNTAGAADEYTLSAEEYARLSAREIIDKVLAKWSKLENTCFSYDDMDAGISRADELDKVIQELRDTILWEQHREADL